MAPVFPFLGCLKIDGNIDLENADLENADLVHSFLNKNVVFPAQAEYSYSSADFRLKIF